MNPEARPASGFFCWLHVSSGEPLARGYFLALIDDSMSLTSDL